MNSQQVLIPSDSLMRSDLNHFIEETYKRFYIRDITEAERKFAIDFFESNPDVSSDGLHGIAPQTNISFLKYLLMKEENLSKNR